MPSKWQRQEFFAGSPSAQTFTVPANVTLVYLTMVGGGGGGGRAPGTPSVGGAGGGAGECCIRMPVKVTPGDSIPVEIGEAGLGGIRTAASLATAGGDSTFGTIRCAGGGFGARGGTGNLPGGNGGGAGRALGVLSGDGVIGTVRVGSAFVGGASGGGYENTAVSTRSGGPAAGVGPTPPGTTDGTRSTGGSGASSQWGTGGIGGDSGTAPADTNGDSADPTHYGAGGGAAGTYNSSPVPAGHGDGGDGAPGYALVEWFAEV